MSVEAGDKQALREELLERRNAIAPLVREKAALDIAHTNLSFAGITSKTTSAKTVSGFYPFGSELDARPLLGKLANAGFTTALPVIIAKAQPLVFRAWKPGDPLIKGVWDIPVPHLKADQVIPEIVLVPLLGFDDEGYRIGYGGGYYDRTLARLAETRKIVSVGLAFTTQHMSYIPREAHDIPLDWILTEKGPVRGKEPIS